MHVSNIAVKRLISSIRGCSWSAENNLFRVISLKFLLILVSSLKILYGCTVIIMQCHFSSS